MDLPSAEEEKQNECFQCEIQDNIQFYLIIACAMNELGWAENDQHSLYNPFPGSIPLKFNLIRTFLAP